MVRVPASAKLDAKGLTTLKRSAWERCQRAEPIIRAVTVRECTSLTFRVHFSTHSYGGGLLAADFFCRTGLSYRVPV
jgi:hypothetical protein